MVGAAGLTVPSYRATIRYRTDRQRYHMEDVDAPDLRAALSALMSRFPDELAASADLLEIRRQLDDDERAFTPD